MAIVDVGGADDAEARLATARDVLKGARLIALVPIGQTKAKLDDFARAGVVAVSKPVRGLRLLRALAAALSKDELPAANERTSAAPAERRGKRVLVAEDNAVNQLVERRMLEQLGYEVDIAENGLRALEKLREQPYDVVFLDMQMPELDGLATATRIVEEWPRARRPRLIALTANAVSGNRERCLAAGWMTT